MKPLPRLPETVAVKSGRSQSSNSLLMLTYHNREGRQNNESSIMKMSKNQFALAEC